MSSFMLLFSPDPALESLEKTVRGTLLSTGELSRTHPPRILWLPFVRSPPRQPVAAVFFVGPLLYLVAGNDVFGATGARAVVEDRLR